MNKLITLVHPLLDDIQRTPEQVELLMGMKNNGGWTIKISDADNKTGSGTEERAEPKNVQTGKSPKRKD